MRTQTIYITGMHCKSCEIMLEKHIRRVPNVRAVSVHHKTGLAEISYEGDRPDEAELAQAIKAAGYSLGGSSAASGRSCVSRDPMDYAELAASATIVLLIYAVASRMGWLDLAVAAGGKPSLGTVFLIGLTAGVSSCMALVGGLVLGLAAEHAKLHPAATGMQNFRPHLYFNAGRVVSYALLGGIAGWVGSMIAPSPVLLAALTILVGILMLVLGLSLVGIFPRLGSGIAFMPKRLTKLFGLHADGNEYSHAGALLLGAATFFIPCGFTQAMQLYAVSTGSFVSGFSIMLAFALGTLPMLLGVGWLSSYLKGTLGRYFFRIAGVAVLVFALVNIYNGLGQLGISVPLPQISFPDSSPAVSAEVSEENGKQIQILRMDEERAGYVPNVLAVRKGIPVKWIITAKYPYSCAAAFTVPSLGIRGFLQEGENIIEFVPETAGEIPFMCAMGMYRGIIQVTE